MSPNSIIMWKKVLEFGITNSSVYRNWGINVFREAKRFLAFLHKKSGRQSLHSLKLRRVTNLVLLYPETSLLHFIKQLVLWDGQRMKEMSNDSNFISRCSDSSLCLNEQWEIIHYETDTMMPVNWKDKEGTQKTATAINDRNTNVEGC